MRDQADASRNKALEEEIGYGQLLSILESWPQAATKEGRWGLKKRQLAKGPSGEKPRF